MAMGSQMYLSKAVNNENHTHGREKHIPINLTIKLMVISHDRSHFRMIHMLGGNPPCGGLCGNPFYGAPSHVVACEVALMW